MIWLLQNCQLHCGSPLFRGSDSLNCCQSHPSWLGYYNIITTVETGNEAIRMLLSLSCLPLQWLCVQERKHWRQQTLQPHPTLWTQISLGWRRQWQNDSLLCRMRCNSCPCRKNLAQSTKHWHVKCIILFCGNINSPLSLSLSLPAPLHLPKLSTFPSLLLSPSFPPSPMPSLSLLSHLLPSVFPTNPSL